MNTFSTSAKVYFISFPKFILYFPRIQVNVMFSCGMCDMWVAVCVCRRRQNQNYTLYFTFFLNGWLFIKLKMWWKNTFTCFYPFLLDQNIRFLLHAESFFSPFGVIQLKKTPNVLRDWRMLFDGYYIPSNASTNSSLARMQNAIIRIYEKDTIR